MKKALLLIVSLFCIQAALAYETVIVKFPPNQGWHADFYQHEGVEAILQYVPVGENAQNWNRTVIFHAYKNVNWTSSTARFMDKMTMQMENKNSSGLYKYLKYTENDSIAVRCVTKNAYIPTQCEIYRVSKSFEGLISMHYINKNVQDYKATFDMWYQIMKDVLIYQSYYREDRIMDKATSFEL
ncbi:MAG: hypothetical protein PHC64_01360 [Candidatus Gastranaerophilales bacterium]|nr:hypothetical protein [Candidatus Gastranaerophilales bacterium]